VSVFVDDMEAPFGRYVMCHMWADTYEELIAMAQQIGVAVKWLQYPPNASWVHFDIALTKRALAVAAGAREMRWRDCLRYAKAQAYNSTYRAFYVHYWSYQDRDYDYETGTFGPSRDIPF
jgi:uncharacterized protein DUF4031